MVITLWLDPRSQPCWVQLCPGQSTPGTGVDHKVKGFGTRRGQELSGPRGCGSLGGGQGVGSQLSGPLHGHQPQWQLDREKGAAGPCEEGAREGQK